MAGSRKVCQARQPSAHEFDKNKSRPTRKHTNREWLTGARYRGLAENDTRALSVPTDLQGEQMYAHVRSYLSILFPSLPAQREVKSKRVLETVVSDCVEKVRKVLSFRLLHE